MTVKFFRSFKTGVMKYQGKWKQSKRVRHNLHSNCRPWGSAFILKRMFRGFKDE